jgi:hypothetical protein
MKKRGSYARRTDPVTSHDAAESVDVSRLERQVVDALRNAPRGLTWDELHRVTRIDKASISPRLKPLRDKRLIDALAYPNGESVKRPGDSGRNQTVWVAL